MIFRRSSLPFLFAAAVASLLISCSDAEIGPSDVPVITQAIYVVPENYYDEPYKKYVSSENFYVNINQKIKICGIYTADKDTLPIDLSAPYYSSHRWTIDDREAFASVVYYSFDKAGVHKVTFETIDKLGDTLVSHANIYVNTPTTISLQSPPNHYNQVDGINANGLELSWKIYGIDPWETSQCYIYASYFRDSLWVSPLGAVKCNNSVSLLDTLNMKVSNGTDKPSTKTNDFGDTLYYGFENSTIYWGVHAVIKNGKGDREHVFSDVYSFSTKLQNDGNAIVEVPVACRFNQYPEKSRLVGAIISSAGDTLSKISGIKGNATIRKTLDPQSNVKIVVCDSVRTEYGCSSMTVNLAPSTKTITDTLFLQDKVKPSIVPAATELSRDDRIKFLILDNGSGVNASRITALLNNDTVNVYSYFEDYTLTIPNICKKNCELKIYAEDYANNKAPDVYWRITNEKETTFITGPFSKTEGSK